VAKLTLSVDDAVVARAKTYAARRGTSVSHLVERFLDAVARPRRTADEDLPPVTKRLFGALRGAKVDREEYVDYLERKFR
jgi:hypothetical protein